MISPTCFLDATVKEVIPLMVEAPGATLSCDWEGGGNTDIQQAHYLCCSFVRAGLEEARRCAAMANYRP